MALKRFSANTEETSPQDDDIVPGTKDSTNLDKKFKFSTLGTYVKTFIGDATALLSGLMSATDKAKVDQYPVEPGVVNRALLSDGAGNFVLVDIDTFVETGGATLNVDTDLTGYGYFIDEDDMISDDDTKVPSQQSVKAFLQAHKDELTVHRIINDSSSSITELLSASKIKELISGVVSGIDVKDPVATSTKGLGAITLSGEQLLNGVTTSVSRVVVSEQGGDEATAHVDNGLYLTGPGAWARTEDADEDAEITNGLLTVVLDENSDRYREKYVITTSDGIIVGVTPIKFVSIPSLEFGTTAGTACEGNDPRLIFNVFLPFAASDEITPIVVGVNRVQFYMPYGMTLSEIRATSNSAPVGSEIEIDVYHNSVTILSTNITIDDGELTSSTAATPPVISNPNLLDEAYISVEFVAVGSTNAGEGIKLTFIGVRV